MTLKSPLIFIELTRFAKLRGAYLITALIVVFALCISCSLIYPSTFTVTLGGEYQKVTLDEAGRLVGEQMPVLTYLPEGYEIREVYIKDTKKFSRWYLKYLISDEAIEWNCNECKTKMVLFIDWRNVGGLKFLADKGERIPSDIEGKVLGILVDEGEYNSFYWITKGHLMVLSVIKSISSGELVKIVNSVTE